MSAIGSWLLQKAIVTALQANAPLMAIAKGVYDEVPEGAQFPLVVVGEGREEDDSTMGQRGHLCVPDIQVWTADGAVTTDQTGAAGYKTALAIAELIVDTIMGDDFTVEGHDVTVLRYEAVDRARDDADEPNLRSVVPRLVILLEDQ